MLLVYQESVTQNYKSKIEMTERQPGKQYALVNKENKT